MTAPFELGGGDDACLLLHGFTGSPWEMRPLGEALAARGYYVSGIRLPGHGASAALEQVTHRDWEQAAEDALLSLRNFRQVFVAGLSMGALLALLLAARHPERVHALALLAPAMRFARLPVRLLKAVRGLPLLEFFWPRFEKTRSDIEDASVRAEAPVLRKVPSAWLHDLWAVQDKARAALGQVHAPSLIAAAEKDHVVSMGGARELARGLINAPAVRFIAVSEGFHILTRDKGREVVLGEVAEFFDRLKG
ncbi:MAG: alpha/beta fold hydrolase [Myxococcales bacterium]|nr:alpha/beta fold hydrolase [Myxococcales bacterium]